MKSFISEGSQFFINSLLLSADVIEYLNFKSELSSQPETLLSAGVLVGCLFISSQI